MKKTNTQAECLLQIFNFSENGFSMRNNTVAIPACRIKAHSMLEAIDKLNNFLSTKILSDEIELITPLERIEFETK